MAKLFYLILLVLVVGQTEKTVAEYSDADQIYQQDAASVSFSPAIKGSQVVLSKPDREADQYTVSYYTEPQLAESREHDLNGLGNLYRIVGLRAPQLKRLFVTGNREPFIEMDDQYGKVLGFNKWGADTGLEGSE